MTFDEVAGLLKKGIAGLREPELKLKWDKVFRRVVVHSRGAVPKDLFLNAFPNEEADVVQYRERNYQAITQGIYYRGYTDLYRALSESNWSLVAPDYFLSWWNDKQFDSLSGNQFYFKTVLWRKLEDPNGCLVVKLLEAGPDMELVHSSQIRYVSDDIFIWRSKKKVKVGASSLDAYEILTDLEYLIYVPVSKDRYELISVATHGLGEVPYVVLKGIPTGEVDFDGTEKKWFDSDFSPFISHANHALLNKELHKGAMVTSAYPIRIMRALPCTAQGCRDGRIFTDSGEFVEKCKTCKGTGKVVPTSVYKGIILDERHETNTKALDFAYPDTAIISLSGEVSDKDLVKAQEALHQRFIEMAQSGTAKDKDREDKFSMLFNFQGYWFDGIMRKTLNWMLKMKFPGKADEIKIIKPISFKIKDELELLAEYRDAVTNDLSYGVILNIYLDYIKRRFSTDEVSRRIEELAIITEPLYLYPTSKRDMFLANGTMDKSEYRRVNHVVPEANKLLLDMGPEAFMAADLQVLSEKLKKELQAFSVEAPAFDSILSELSEKNENKDKNENGDF